MSLTMESERYALKFYVRPPCGVPDQDFILFFHRVIQESLLSETCIDVTDYSHVPNGPGVMLICHEAHYSMDHGGGRLGLKCATKRGGSGDAAARLRRVMQKTLQACAAMEAHEIFGGRVRFDTAAALFSIEDRLVAPNTPETFAALAPALAGLAQRAWGTAPLLARTGTPKECFQVELSAPSVPSLEELLARLQ
jgi:hypothetical protein